MRARADKGLVEVLDGFYKVRLTDHDVQVFRLVDGYDDQLHGSSPVPPLGQMPCGDGRYAIPNSLSASTSCARPWPKTHLPDLASEVSRARFERMGLRRKRVEVNNAKKNTRPQAL